MSKYPLKVPNIIQSDTYGDLQPVIIDTLHMKDYKGHFHVSCGEMDIESEQQTVQWRGDDTCSCYMIGDCFSSVNHNMILLYAVLYIITWYFLLCSKFKYDITYTVVNYNMILHTMWFNTSRLRQHGRHFPDNIFKCIFLNENVWIAIKIFLKFVPKGPINNIPALVQKMACRRPGDKPLSEPMMVSLPMHICITWPQWVNPD